MKIISINAGKCKPLQGSHTDDNVRLTGIYKHALSSPVRVTRDGLVGDEIGDPRYHGGPDQAVYIYGLTDYEWWESKLNCSLEPGTFGDNLTLSDFDNAALAIGDRFRIGDVLLEITAPRIPCATLSRRMDDSAFLKKFRTAERPGVYCRVLEEGEIQCGDDVQFELYPGDRLSILEVYRAEFVPPKDAVTLRRHLSAPLAVRFREGKEKRLAGL